MSWRRTKEDWRLLTNMHRSFVRNQPIRLFRRGLQRGAWRSEMPPPIRRLRGAPRRSRWRWRWIFSARLRLCTLRNGLPGARECGRPSWPVDGWCPRIFRGMAVTMARWRSSRARAEDEFTTRVTLKSVKDGSTLSALRQRPGVRGIFLARPVEGAAKPGSRAGRSCTRNARSDVDSIPINSKRKAAGIGASIRSSVST